MRVLKQRVTMRARESDRETHAGCRRDGTGVVAPLPPCYSASPTFLPHSLTSRTVVHLPAVAPGSGLPKGAKLLQHRVQTTTRHPLNGRQAGRVATKEGLV